MSEGCVFCDQSWMRAAEIFIETPHCIFASTRDPDIRAQAGLADGVLPGSGAIVPIAHRTSVFELTPAEWADTQDLLLQARMALHDLLGWNQGGTCIPICMSFHDSTTSRCLTAGCARRSTSRRTGGPTHGRQGTDGHFRVSGEPGAGPQGSTSGPAESHAGCAGLKVASFGQVCRQPRRGAIRDGCACP